MKDFHSSIKFQVGEKLNYRTWGVKGSYFQPLFCGSMIFNSFLKSDSDMKSFSPN